MRVLWQELTTGGRRYESIVFGRDRGAANPGNGRNLELPDRR